MSTSHDAARVYADFSGFARMRADARGGAEGSTERVARQFESIFVQMMLKSMRDTIPDSGLFGGSMRTFQDLFDRQVSLDLTAERGIGLADMLVRQINALQAGGAAGERPVPPQIAPGAFAAAMRPSSSTPPAPVPRGASASPGSESTTRTQPVAAGDASKRRAFSSQEEFVGVLLPYAREAGAALGVDPKVLLAQAALETGWGRHVMTDADGRSANNFFGIKADRRWGGPSVRVATLESLGGVLERVRADFRAYGSPAESFRDYVDFISGHGRYAPVLEAAADPVAYVRGLQSAGYATDPRYAEKILGIVRRAEFTEMVGARQALGIASSRGAEIMREVF